MSKWYYKVSDDISNIPDFINYFEGELEFARKELTIKGGSIEKHAAELPGVVEHRFVQLQEIESVLEFLNIKMKQERSASFKKFLEAYSKTLSSRDAEKYVDGASHIVDLSLLINEVALLRNKFLGITRGLEAKNYMISNIVKLRIAGIEDAGI